MATKVNNNQVNESANEMMDARIVKLNELKGVKMANLSKGKRPAAKEAKLQATYILDNWDNEFELVKMLNDTEVVFNDDIKAILSSRLQNFADAKEACKKAVEEAPKKEKKAKAQTKEEVKQEAPSVKLTKNEMEVLIGMAVNAEHYGEHNAFVLSEIKLERPRSINSLSGTMSALNKKGMLLACNGDSYFDGELTEAGLAMVGDITTHLKASKKFKVVATDAKKATKAESTPKAEAKKPTEKKEATKPATSTRKVGDIHKNGKWVWTEYAPGKFDWRTIPSMKQKTGAKPKVETEGKKAEKKQTATKSNKAEKSTAKQTKKGEPKKNSPEAPKVLTIDEFVALPVKTAKTNKKPSPTQAEALKLINKGYRITADQKFFEKDGDRKSCNMDSVTAMFKRYGIDYIPEGLIIK